MSETTVGDVIPWTRSDEPLFVRHGEYWTFAPGWAAAMAHAQPRRLCIDGGEYTRRRRRRSR